MNPVLMSTIDFDRMIDRNGFTKHVNISSENRKQRNVVNIPFSKNLTRKYFTMWKLNFDRLKQCFEDVNKKTLRSINEKGFTSWKMCSFLAHAFQVI